MVRSDLGLQKEESSHLDEMRSSNHISTQSKGSLTLECNKNIGGHYIKALQLWRENFLLNFDDKIMPALLNSNPSTSKETVEVFRRKSQTTFLHIRF